MEPPVASRVTAYAGCGLSLLTLRCQRRDNHPLCLPSADHGAIPARTGEPRRRRWRRTCRPVYPRAYGGTDPQPF